MNERKFNLEARLLDFSVKIIKVVEDLPNQSGKSCGRSIN